MNCITVFTKGRAHNGTEQTHATKPHGCRAQLLPTVTDPEITFGQATAGHHRHKRNTGARSGGGDGIDGKRSSRS